MALRTIPQQSSRSRPRTPASLGLALVLRVSVGLALTGAGRGSCGGTEPARAYMSSLDQRCDTLVNGKPPAGCGGTPGLLNPSSSGCPAADPGMGFCAVCSSTDQCSYCPSDALCPSDPCGATCTRPSTSSSASRCPQGYPTDCGNGYCCPSSASVCCAGEATCGASESACNPPSTPSTGGGAFDCSPGASRVTCQFLTTCNRCNLSACGGPDGSACAFYKSSDGQLFGDSCGDNRSTFATCSQRASQDALRHCGCI